MILGKELAKYLHLSSFPSIVHHPHFIMTLSLSADDLILKNFDDKNYDLDLSRRVAVLEKRVQDQEDYIVCLKSTMADAHRKIAELERMVSSPKSKCLWVLR